MSLLAKKGRFIPLHLLSVEAEGFSYLPRQVILIHESITVVNGENGSGKTTFLNMLRVLFGATKFDNGHTFKTFFERDHVHFIYIIGRFDNTIHPEYQKRPFQEIGKYNDRVSVVCRLTNDNPVKREFLIFDGNFDLEIHLKDNIKWLEVGHYLSHMEQVGMSKALANVFSLYQGNTEKLLGLNEEQLADYLLQICGEQERIDKFNNIKINLEELYKQYQELGRQKQQEELVIQNVKQKIDRIKQIKQNEQQLEENQFNKELAVVKDMKEIMNEQEALLNTLKDEKLLIEQNINTTNNDINTTNHEIEKYSNALSNVNKKIDDNHRQTISLTEKKINLETKANDLLRFINKYKHIVPVSLEKLNHELSDITDLYKRQVTIVQNLQHKEDTIMGKIHHIKTTHSAHYPSIVSKMIEKLKERQLNHLLLAEQLEITDNKWRHAIEALLGAERFTITVDEHAIIETMKIAQEIGYPYWISPFKPVSLSYKNESILSKVNVLDERITGYIERFKNFMMAESMEAAWDWVQKDFNALLYKPTPYQVISRGGRSIHPNGIYCGRKSYLLQLEQLQEDLNNIQQKLDSEKAKENELQIELESVNKAIEDQKMRALIPDKENEHLSLTGDLQIVLNSLTDFNVQIQSLRKEREKVQQLASKYSRRHGKLNYALTNLQSKQKEIFQKQSDIMTSLDTLKSQYNSTVSKLSKDQIKKLSDCSYLESIKTVEHYTTLISSLQNMIQQLRNTGEPIQPGEENIVALEEKYNIHLKLLQNHLNEISETEAKLENLRKKHDEAQEEYLEMVEEVFRKVKKSLEELAAQGNINATLKLINVGNERWKIDYKVGFHGKVPVSYRTKTAFSGGQKVIISLLLTLSAIQADGMLNFMILDEPFAHLDQERTELVSQFLKKTGAQYIIAMPYSENLKLLYPFADMSLNFRPKRENQEMAPPINYGIVNDEFIKQQTQYKASS
ncbi:AAA family ATPase [Schinkia azotoformans]|uniref:AAA family ATPase n=1 Tax=Schinkia azotoformans TaxID=1454 RepID=UPI002DBA8BA0|nr:AAA family ATPase [Schinkia azotoformans]MEC1722183.1 hypothetical protein [Schinkia azotoformans]MED4412455.1 hypothetical protein [Schinkia azotoformans]